MDDYPVPPPPKTNAAEDETMTGERKRTAWSKPIIRHIGQTVYTGTGTKMSPAYPSELVNYQPPTS